MANISSEKDISVFRLSDEEIRKKADNRSLRRGFDYGRIVIHNMGSRFIKRTKPDKNHLVSHETGERLFQEFVSGSKDISSYNAFSLSGISQWCIHKGNLAKIESEYSELYNSVIIPRYLADYFKFCSELANKFGGSKYYDVFVVNSKYDTSLNDRLNFFMLDEPIIAEKIVNSVSGPFLVSQFRLGRRVSKSFTGKYDTTLEELVKRAQIAGYCFYCKGKRIQNYQKNSYYCHCD